MNRGWSVCLLLAGLMSVPGVLSAQENEEQDEYVVTVTIGEIMPNGDHVGCPDYLSSGRDDAPWAGYLEEESEVRERTGSTTRFNAGGGYNGIGAGVNHDRFNYADETYGVGYYMGLDGQLMRIDCRTLTEITD